MTHNTKNGDQPSSAAIDTDASNVNPKKNYMLIISELGQKLQNSDMSSEMELLFVKDAIQRCGAKRNCGKAPVTPS